MDLAPIVLFAYNRPEHTKLTLNALADNVLASGSVLYIYCDGPKAGANLTQLRKINEVREIAKREDRFGKVTVIERNENNGLANSIIAGVAEVIHKHDKIIVLEDDIVTSKYFLNCMNTLLEYYQDDLSIASITGYSFLQPEELMTYRHDFYLSYRHSSWGWGTWKRVWEAIDWDIEDYSSFKEDSKKQKLFNRGGNDLTKMLYQQMNGLLNSWSIRFDYNCYKNNQLCVMPSRPIVKNIGFDGSGTHCDVSDEYAIKLDTEFGLKVNLEPITINESIVNAIKRKHDDTLNKKIHRKIKQFSQTIQLWNRVLS